MPTGDCARTRTPCDRDCPDGASTLSVIRGALVVLLVYFFCIHAAGAAEHRAAGAFDYYVLSLSWSPTYCASRRGRTDALQCSSGRRYDFVVHGLWPQYRKGWPQYCADSGNGPPEPLVAAMLDIMPSPGLVRHQWNKHGTCTGLAPGDYFALTRQLYESLRIPARYITPGRSIEVSAPRIVADFLATNRALARDMISVQCGNRRGRARLAELRICFSRHGAPRACGDNERRQCQAERLVLPPAR